MSDPRLRRWAEVLVRYSVGVVPGDKFMINSAPAAAPLIKEVYREALRVGAHPHVNLGLPGLQEIFFKEASEEQLRYVSPIEEMVTGSFDATLAIGASVNTRALSNADPAKQAIASQAR
ncbi:MAG TPA: aminopeptidase, partial [Ktedonobacterales bacterium]